VPPLEVLFSIEEPTDPATVPPFGHGDEASDRGYVATTNEKLLRNFHPMPGPTPVDYGLDALFEFRAHPAAVSACPLTLFSTEEGFFDEMLGQFVSDGDLLSVCGRVVATNRQLLANFSPMPPVPDMGLDAVFIPHHLLKADCICPPEIWFSTEQGWFDESLGRYISDGDLLSTRGYVVATNAQLLVNFHPMPPTPDCGLDAVFVPRCRLPVSETNRPEIWFSVEEGFWDEQLACPIQEGDLLSTTGKIIRTNRQLMRKFPSTGTANVDYGLDAVHVRQRALISSHSPSYVTLPKMENNILRLMFDGPVELPVELPVSILPVGGQVELNGAFDYAIETFDLDDDTLVVTEIGGALPNQAWYRVEVAGDLDVEPFVLDVCTLRGDADGDGQVLAFDYFEVKNNMFEMTDARCDLDGDGQVLAFDYFVVKNHMFDQAPPKP
jgi:hypothetical protein